MPTGTAICSDRSVWGEIPSAGGGDTRMNLFSTVTRRLDMVEEDRLASCSGGAIGTCGASIIRDANAASGMDCG